jgi:hypothetical protein
MRIDVFGGKKLLGILIVLVLMVSITAGWWFLIRRPPRLISFEQSYGSQGRSFSYKSYESVLQAYVDESGKVDYGKLQVGRDQLDAFAAEIGSLSPVSYSGWNEKEQMVFWINVYNALTLEAIIDHYPIQASVIRSVIFPSNSIRQISGVWDRLQFLVMGEKRTLDEIEHQILRKLFNEPRIHMALVCAAKGCPPLRNEPYTGEQLDQQLGDQARRFLSNPSKFRIDREKDRVYLSPIFDWFGNDFVMKYGAGQAFGKQADSQKAVLNFIMGYLNRADRDYLSQGDYRVEYLEYDWSLNERSYRKEIS